MGMLCMQSSPSNLSLVIWRASLLIQTVKNLPVMQETWIQSLGWKDTLEKRMATHFIILAWRILWTEEPVAESDRTEWLTNTFTSFSVWLSQVLVKHGETEELQSVFMDLYSDGNEDPLANVFVCQGWGNHIKFEFWKIYLAALWNVTWEEMWLKVVRRIHRWK